MSRQTDLSDDYAHEGLADAGDYNHAANLDAVCEYGDAEQEWPQYGLAMRPLLFNGEDTGRRHILRNGSYLEDVSDDYKLLPNEHLIDVANDVARDLDAIPFHEWSREGDDEGFADDGWFVTLDDHVFQNPDRTRVHGLYAWEDDDVGGDEMSYGFAVHNSIDRSLGFSVGLFTFRHACANMVFMGTGSSHEERALRVESEREIVNRTTHAHTSGLAVERDELEAVITSTLTLVDDVHETYTKWVSERLTAEDVLGLLKRPSISQKDLPNWIIDTDDELDDSENDVVTVLEAVTEQEADEGEDLPFDRQCEIVEARIPEGEMVWDTYNDLTNAIWIGSGSADTTKRRKFKDVHRVFDPVEHGATAQTVR